MENNEQGSVTEWQIIFDSSSGMEDFYTENESEYTEYFAELSANNDLDKILQCVRKDYILVDGDWQEDWVEVLYEPDEDNTDTDDDILELLQERVGQRISIGELNTVLQSIFADYNKIYLMINELYNMDIDEVQELSILEDGDFYIISYKIVDLNNGIVQITDVNVE